jgi:16S rRNA (uracil1498-N3)-methyltransferase
MRRFYSTNFTSDKITLNVDETRHLRDVLRLKIGEKIQVFDGKGKELLCEIESIEKKQTILQIIEEVLPKSPESDLNLCLGVAILKGEKFDLIVQKAVELGVEKIVPILTKRCDAKSVRLDRLERIILEATKQCGRAKLLQIAETQEFSKFIETSEGTKLLFSERFGESFSTIKPSKKIVALIGSEGGWEDSEIESAKQKGFQIITLGGRILRAETAVISIASLLQHNFGDLR